LAARRRPRRGARDGAWPLVDGRGGRPRRRSHRCPPLVRDIAYDGAVGVITHGPVCGRCVRRWPLSRALPRAARHSAARHSAARHSAARGGGWGKRPVSLLKRRAARRLSQIARDWAAARGDAHISSCRTRHRRALRRARWRRDGRDRKVALGFAKAAREEIALRWVYVLVGAHLAFPTTWRGRAVVSMRRAAVSTCAVRGSRSRSRSSSSKGDCGAAACTGPCPIHVRGRRCRRGHCRRRGFALLPLPRQLETKRLT
jgi:hypothetical protein